jgi:hypothetical protein
MIRIQNTISKSIFLLSLLCLAFSVEAETVKLKVTYNGKGVANNDVTIKIGNAALGSGRTDTQGNVSINVSQLPTRSIDVYGSVQTNNGNKNWDVKGWVVLDNNLYSELKFEEIFEEMGMPAGMFAEAWGLTFSTKGGAAPSNNSGASPTKSAPTPAPVAPAPVVPAAPALKPGYTCEPASEAVFGATLKNMQSKSFSSDKIQIARKFMDGNCYDADQTRQLMEQLTMESDRLELAKYAYKKVANQGQFESGVASAFKMSLNRDNLHDYIEDQKGGGGSPVFKTTSPTANNSQPAPAKTKTTTNSAPAKESNATAPSTKGSGNAQPATSPTESVAASAPAQAPAAPERDKMNFRTENGELFTLFIDGEQINDTPANDVTASFKEKQSMMPRVKVVFAEPGMPVVEKKVLLTGHTDYYVYIVKKNEKGDWIYKLKI